MDVLQATMELFNNLLSKLKAIKSFLIGNYLPDGDEEIKNLFGSFWIFSFSAGN